MPKRIISIMLALIMVFGLFTVSVGAADIKILGNLSISVGETKPLSFTDPSGNKVNVIWESSDPGIATVTATGSVTALKPGTCVMSALWNGKVYGVNVTVNGAKTAKKISSSGNSAYAKLKNYLIKNGTKDVTNNGQSIYYLKWETKSYRYWISYSASLNYIEYAIVMRKNASSDLGRLQFIQYGEKNTVKIHLTWTKDSKSNNLGDYSKNYKKNTFNIKKSVKLKYSSGKKYSNANSLANKFRKKLYSAINSKLKKKTGLSFKSLGMEYTKKAKKISISKKSAAVAKGKTLKLKLKNAKASKVKWSSSKKKIASVTKKGIVKAKKKGKATITAKYKGKKYKCKITVKTKAKKKAITVKQAFNKVKSYLIKNGTKYKDGAANLYSAKWTKGGINYYLEYNDKYNDFTFEGDYTTSSVMLIIDLFVDTKATSDCQFYSKTNNDESTHYYMANKFTKKSFVLENIPDFTFDGGNKQSFNTMNMNAKAALEWMFPDFNSYIKSKTGVTMKQLGFKKWK